MDIKGKSVFSLPDRLYNEMQTPMGVMFQVLAGDKAWMKMGPQTRDLSGAALAEMKKGLWTESGCAVLFRAALDGKVEAQALGKTKFEGADAEVVLVRSADNLKVFLSPDGATLLGTSRMAQTQEGPTEVVEIYGALTVVSGLRIPFEQTQKAKGEVVASAKLTSVKINAGFDEGIFKKPEAPPAK
jgi:SpoU rRNA methylase family enzyme